MQMCGAGAGCSTAGAIREDAGAQGLCHRGSMGRVEEQTCNAMGQGAVSPAQAPQRGALEHHDLLPCYSEAHTAGPERQSCSERLLDEGGFFDAAQQRQGLLHFSTRSCIWTDENEASCAGGGLRLCCL